MARTGHLSLPATVGRGAEPNRTGSDVSDAARHFRRPAARREGFGAPSPRAFSVSRAGILVAPRLPQLPP